MKVRDHFDLRHLIPREPEYKPRRGYGWICFCVFNEKHEIVDTVTISENQDKGFSAVHGELDYGKLQQARELWRELKSNPGKWIENSALLH